jgi:hypothetical protein
MHYQCKLFSLLCSTVALHLKNDDGITPLDLALADESVSDAVVALLQKKPPPPELTRRQMAEIYEERAAALKRKVQSIHDSGGRQDKDPSHTLSTVQRLVDQFPHVLYAANMDPNELEIALLDQIGQMNVNQNNGNQEDAKTILMEAIRKHTLPVVRDTRGAPLGAPTPNPTLSPSPQQQQQQQHPGMTPILRNRVEDLLSSIVGLSHVKSQVGGLHRTAEVSGLRASLVPTGRNVSGGQGPGPMALVPPALAEDPGHPMPAHIIRAGNPGMGKTAIA